MKKSITLREFFMTSSVPELCDPPLIPDPPVEKQTFVYRLLCDRNPHLDFFILDEWLRHPVYLDCWNEGKLYEETSVWKLPGCLVSGGDIAFLIKA